MKTLCQTVILFLALTPLASAQGPLDALTGTYSGTLVRQHSLSVNNATPPKVVKFKQTARVAGFGYVPVGKARTTIELILPSSGFFNAGQDQRIIIDFQQDPPSVAVEDGANVRNLSFHDVTVSGKVVTVVFQTSLNGSNLSEPDVRTLKIMRTKPE
jgi:hypothetical protein